ncbi:hypothetical protein BJ684DRAFT_17149 [Piptocephalis cylindrospora]|uniref:Uncharacterized protein n=1 Tax=Piptocephalis cylindrospora TaxID=1907219 RepID=A0A4P9Y2Q6_9FUNG|nr:hypothetical protein BJ684DRAFT_17149 [Piptocephalis cylindrospora]|eukprot:RKP12351.1 hypothetical protein BJ684DRAFT_17149 [Piptocephalis cylindrospora]
MYQKILDKTSQSRESLTSLPKRTGIREAGIGAPTLVMTSSKMVKELPMGSRAQTTNQILRSRQTRGSGRPGSRSGLGKGERAELTERDKKRLSRAEKILGKDAVEAAVQARASILLNNPPANLPTLITSSSKGHRRTDSLGNSDPGNSEGAGVEGGKKKGGWKHLFQKKPSISLGTPEVTASVGAITTALAGKSITHSGSGATGDITSPITRGRAGTFPMRVATQSRESPSSSSPPPTKVTSPGRKTPSKSENKSTGYPPSLSLKGKGDLTSPTSSAPHSRRRRGSGGSISEALDYFHGTSPTQKSPRSPKSPGKGGAPPVKEVEGEERGRGRKKKRSSSSTASLGTLSSSGSSERLSQSPIPPRPIRQVPLPPKYPIAASSISPISSSPDLRPNGTLDNLERPSPPSSFSRRVSGDTPAKDKRAVSKDRKEVNKDQRAVSKDRRALSKERRALSKERCDIKEEGEDLDKKGRGSCSDEDQDKEEDKGKGKEKKKEKETAMSLPSFLPPLSHPPPMVALPPIPGQGLGDIGLMGDWEERGEEDRRQGEASAEQEGEESNDDEGDTPGMPPPLSPMPNPDLSGNGMHKLLMKKHLGVDVTSSLSVRRESDTLSPTTVSFMFKSKEDMDDEKEDDEEEADEKAIERKGSLLRSDPIIFSDGEDDEEELEGDDYDDDDLLDDVLGGYQEEEDEEEEEEEEVEEEEETEEMEGTEEKKGAEDEDQAIPKARTKRLSSVTPLVGLDTSFLEDSAPHDDTLTSAVRSPGEMEDRTLSPSPSTGAEVEGKGKMAPPSTPSGVLSPARSVSPDIDRAVQARQTQILPSKAITPRFPTVGSVKDRVKAIEKVKVDDVAVRATPLSELMTESEDREAETEEKLGYTQEATNMDDSTATDSGMAEEINADRESKEDQAKKTDKQNSHDIDYSEYEFMLDQESQDFLKSLSKSMEAFDNSCSTREDTFSSLEYGFSFGSAKGEEDDLDEEEEEMDDERDEEEDEEEEMDGDGSPGRIKGRKMRWGSMDGARMLQEVEEAIDVHTVAEEVRASALPHNRRGGGGGMYGDFLSPMSADFDVSAYGLSAEEDGAGAVGGGDDTEDEEHMEELMRQLTTP